MKIYLILLTTIFSLSSFAQSCPPGAKDCMIDTNPEKTEGRATGTGIDCPTGTCPGYEVKANATLFNQVGVLNSSDGVPVKDSSGTNVNSGAVKKGH
jgi:hypothetical protein